jgi:hypothetical protein
LRSNRKKLKSIYDPEIPVDIYELGLIWRHGQHRLWSKIIDDTNLLTVR